jgi:hypothetical protein
MNIDSNRIEQALSLLGERLDKTVAVRPTAPYQIVVCGGAALISCSLVSRPTTRDVDIVAMLNSGGELVSPDPLPKDLEAVAAQVARDLDLSADWLNNGPSKAPGGLFQVGLPEGLVDRLTSRDFGPCLRVHFVSRTDQIFFKVFASVDSGPGRHFEDLRELKPAPEELEAGARWALTQDGSEGFRVMLLSMLKQMGCQDVAKRIQN